MSGGYIVHYGNLEECLDLAKHVTIVFAYSLKLLMQKDEALVTVALGVLNCEDFTAAAGLEAALDLALSAEAELEVDRLIACLLDLLEVA